MSKRRLTILIILTILLLAIIIIPLLIPIPPLAGTKSPEQLADADSRFIEVNGVRLHYKIAGTGKPVFLMLHGFAASLFTWREVMPELSKIGTVIAFDRPAFGLTERPLQWKGQNPYSPEAQVAFTVGLMDKLGVEQAILVGNSAGGTIALQTALSHPERIQSLILADPAVYSGEGGPSWVRILSRIPQINHLGPLFVRSIQKWGIEFGKSAWHDPSKITPEIWAGYTKPLQAENWDRALWELSKATYDTGLVNKLRLVQTPTLVISGDDDRIVPTDQSVLLSKAIPGASLVVIPNCGHVPQEECPQAFLKAVYDMIEIGPP